ncbi:uncharacterized protein BYT42DRAFT_111415 [Radiomyces spectabilis]|uniref:uncharacterized protein n=1 Tax=Radiomyces spectabilis TaxID=64574 RepID=UPI00221E7CF5|nr:uncharacterized protein BYT42DRAFT_111415 [Radiomyces spectabilis]KAI8369466.1 hypothetical protein BYT42DRAFT_111415 [Radiomyces spectabilis]
MRSANKAFTDEFNLRLSFRMDNNGKLFNRFDRPISIGNDPHSSRLSLCRCKYLLESSILKKMWILPSRAERVTIILGFSSKLTARVACKVSCYSLRSARLDRVYGYIVVSKARPIINAGFNKTENTQSWKCQTVPAPLGNRLYHKADCPFHVLQYVIR